MRCNVPATKHNIPVKPEIQKCFVSIEGFSVSDVPLPLKFWLNLSGTGIDLTNIAFPTEGKVFTSGILSW